MLHGKTRKPYIGCGIAAFLVAQVFIQFFYKKRNDRQ
jgi:hypothetical protein